MYIFAKDEIDLIFFLFMDFFGLLGLVSDFTDFFGEIFFCK